MKIRRLIAMNVPIKNCNLRCHYCYITAQNQVESGPAVFSYSTEHVAKCLSVERLGGPCIINLTGGGETMIPPELPSYIRALLDEGHYLEIVTNGTVSKRFEEIAAFPGELLSHLEFKFSLHYLELKRLQMLETFAANVRLMRDSGCSYTIECTPTDELEPYIDELKAYCLDNFGALCQLTIARDDLNGSKEILSGRSFGQYCKVWEQFDSTMFAFKRDIYLRKCPEFCYAGCWSLYVDMGSGRAKPCYGQMSDQNIFEDPAAPIRFDPVGKHCRQPYCYNGHAFLALGCIPELDTPTYSDIRNRVCSDGTEWEYHDLKEAFSAKLYDANEVWDEKKKNRYERTYIARIVKTAAKDMPEIIDKIKARLQLIRVSRWG